MKFISALASLAIAAASVAGQQNHTVTVGQNGLTFSPWNMTAEVGDLITFVFYAKNHTVTQSTFAAPCSLLQNATSGQTGFDSGYVPVDANATQHPAWTIRVTDTKPIWGYCAQSGHCQQGMVFAVNAPTNGTNTAAAFLAAAKAAGNSSAAGSATGGSSSVVSGTAASPSAASSSSTSSSSGSAAQQFDATAVYAAIFASTFVSGLVLLAA